MKRWVLLAVTLGVLAVGLTVSQSSKVGLGERSIIFIVLGVLLLGVSILYNKYREKVR